MSSTGRLSGGRLVVLGTSHHVAPVPVREALATTVADDGRVLAAQVRAHLGPVVVLSTCNRLETYCWTARPRASVVSTLLRLLAGGSGPAAHELRPYLYVYSGLDAVQHLIRVAAGLDSLALGESQILGQVRAAWRHAAEQGGLGAELDTVFRRAIEAARRIRAQGAFDRHPSVASIAAGAAAAALGGLAGRQVAVLGAGATGKLALRALLDAGARHVVLLNRSLERAQAVVAATGGSVEAAPLEQLPRVLAEVDAIVCATAAPRPVVTAAAVAQAMAARHSRPLVLVDIAIPRDVEPQARGLAGVQLIDLDDLEARCALDGAARRRELERAEALARLAARACIEELRVREVVPDIVAVRRYAQTVRETELRRVARRLGNLAPEQQEAIEHLTYAIVQKLLHGPTIALRRSGRAGGSRARRTRETIVSALLGGSLPAGVAAGAHQTDPLAG